jgi:hypothetical protein
MLRRWFYLLLGFTFPFFWAFHDAGMLKVLYFPLQVLASTSSTGWPSFVTAFLLYLVLGMVFEIMYRIRKDISPE